MSAEEKYRKAREKIVLLRDIVALQKQRLATKEVELLAVSKSLYECEQHCERFHSGLSKWWGRGASL